jgi:hypothetical protein
MIGALVVVLSCSVGMGVVIDFTCNRNIDTWAPEYPGARLVEQQYEGLRPRAMGRSFSVYATDDDLATVRDWYREQIRAVAMEEMDRGLAQTAYRLAAGPDGDGTILTITTDCAWN